jgi:hypothetical protein
MQLCPNRAALRRDSNFKGQGQVCVAPTSSSFISLAATNFEMDDHHLSTLGRRQEGGGQRSSPLLFIICLVFGVLGFLGICGCCFLRYLRRRDRRKLSQVHIATGRPHEFESHHANIISFQNKRNSRTNNPPVPAQAAVVTTQDQLPPAQPAQHLVQGYYATNAPPGATTDASVADLHRPPPEGYFASPVAPAPVSTAPTPRATYI